MTSGMTSHWYNLGWLLDAPDNFNQRCKDLTAEDVTALRGLVQYRLNDNQLRKLAKFTAKNKQTLKGLDPYHICILSNANVEFFDGALTGSALRHGLALEVSFEPMGQTVMAAMNPESAVRAEGVDDFDVYAMDPTQKPPRDFFLSKDDLI